MILFSYSLFGARYKEIQTIIMRQHLLSVYNRLCPLEIYVFKNPDHLP